MASYIYLYEYIPSASSDLTQEQIQIRQDILEFKEGACPERIINDVMAAVRKAVEEDRSNCTICFVPAARQDLTVSRYADMAQSMGGEFKNMVYLNTIELSENYDELLEEDRAFVCDAERVKGKKVIFIDGIYNTGESYDKIVTMLHDTGSSDEYGIYIAKVMRK